MLSHCVYLTGTAIRLLGGYVLFGLLLPQVSSFHLPALCGVIATVTVLQRCALELMLWPLKDASVL